MAEQHSEGYEAVQDKGILLSEQGVQLPRSTGSWPRRQHVGVGLLLVGIAAVGTHSLVNSRSISTGRLSSKVSLQAYGGYADPAYAYQDPAAAYGAYGASPTATQYGYPAYGAAAPQYAADPYAVVAPPVASPYDQYAGAAAPPAVPAAAFPAAPAVPAAPVAPAGPPPPNGGECVSPGDDCSGPQCCKDPGFQCFMKDANYGTCRAVCEPGMIEEGEKWDCTPLGQPAPVPDGPAKCAWSGENCIALQCCNDANMKCFQKDGYFAGCKFKPPEGWDNTQLGEFRGWHQAYQASGDGEKLGGKLYCIAVKSPNVRVQEEQLLQAAAEMKIGIYSCNANDIFDGAAAPRTDWKSISNTDVFIGVWNQVREKGKFWHNDWTVKADPDCVFFGDRISQHLGKFNVGKDDAVYIKNCDFKFRFQGSLEIFSEKAMEAYMKYAGMCSDKIGHEGGEDFFMMTCMDAMGVKAIEDDDILYDKYATGEHLILDDVSHCSNGWTAAFHPFRTVDVWKNCATAAQQAGQ